MELYYLLVQRSLWTVQLLITFLISSEGRHYRRYVYRPSAPEILPDATNITVHSNEKVILKCTVRNRRTKDVQWRLERKRWPLTIGTEPWTTDKDISVLYSVINKTDESWDLVIKSAKPRHTNTYECQISSTQSNRRYVYLRVLAQPKDKRPGISLTGTAYLDLHQKVNLTCNATGLFRAPDDIDWFHNGNIIDQKDKRWGGRLKIYKRIQDVPGRMLISELIIEKSTLEDRGMYVCRSSENEASSFPVSILDNGVPNKTKRYGTEKVSENKEDDKNSNSAAFNSINVVLITCICVFVSCNS
ncbi:zwei Ig domain protein zig-8-like [Mytilus californianus]|uniref:zwei Ig domain protein zig-8-like n=1 Tax=Mytilus californianus TaxID=6549 RepID=UPI0022460617|nr:zwei Ig domain protein zig-8-like [Mytilus californianus]